MVSVQKEYLWKHEDGLCNQEYKEWTRKRKTMEVTIVESTLERTGSYRSGVQSRRIQLIILMIAMYVNSNAISTVPGRRMSWLQI